MLKTKILKIKLKYDCHHQDPFGHWLLVFRGTKLMLYIEPLGLPQLLFSMKTVVLLQETMLKDKATTKKTRPRCRLVWKTVHGVKLYKIITLVQ